MNIIKDSKEVTTLFKLKRLNDYLMKETEIIYDTFSINFDPHLFYVFKIIFTHKNVTNTCITNHLNITQPATTQSLNKLLKKDLIYIKEKKSDRRKKLIHVSEKGKALIEKANPIWDTIDLVLNELSNFNSNSLHNHLTNLEEVFKKNPFSKLVLERLYLNITERLSITNFKPELSKSFYDLNIEWLKTFFNVEPYDEEVLSNPEKYIIKKGGNIFFSSLDNEIIGTVALMPIKENVFELTKMAVSPKYRGYKIGQKLLEHSIDFSKKIGANEIILYSNTTLKNAIHIYKKYGFKKISIEENSPYKRSDIKMKLVL